jgi:carbamoyl-phosphate synthase large subunit
MGSTNAVAVVKALRAQSEHRVLTFGVDTHPARMIAGSALCDEFQTVPPVVHEDAFLERLASIIRKNSIRLLVPILDEEVELVSRRRHDLPAGCFPLVSPHPTIVLCNDKLKTHGFFLAHGIPTLRTVAAEGGAEDVRRLIAREKIDLPVVVKSRDGCGSRSLLRVNTMEELALFRRIANPIVQELGQGDEYSIDVFGDGRAMIAAVIRKRIETRAGVCYKGRSVRDVVLGEHARSICERLGILGPANIQCFRNGDSVRFSEVNPRFSAGLPLTVAAGVNTPHLALRLALGDPLTAIEDFDEVTMCRYWEEVFYRES